MASRAASLPATLLVATVTIVAGAAIVAAPTVLDCYGGDGDVISCVRDNLTAALLEPPLNPDLPSERDAEPTTVASGVLHAAVPAAAAVTAAPTALIDIRSGTLAAGNWLPDPVEWPTEALAPAAGRLEAGATLTEEHAVEVALAPVPVSVTAAALPVTTAASAGVTLLPSAGALQAGASQNAERLPVAAEMLETTADLGGAGAVDAAPAPSAGATLLPGPAPSEPEPPEPEPTEPEPAESESTAPEPPAVPAQSPEVRPPFDEPLVEAEAEAPAVPRFDPAYPNVLVLPPPAAGSDSSFATLQLN